jgi:hypothetical protein
MNATSFLLELTRTPTCHDFLQPGGWRALNIVSEIETCVLLGEMALHLPLQEWSRVVKSELGIVIFDVIQGQQLIKLCDLVKFLPISTAVLLLMR